MGVVRDGGESVRTTAVTRFAADPEAVREEDRHTAELVRRIQAGERALFAALYERYFDRVYGYLRVLLRDRDEAEDVTQTVFAQLLEGIDSYQPRGAKPFRAWLFVVVRNAAINHLQRGGRVRVEDPEEINRRRERNGGAEQELPMLDWISDADLLLFVERLPAAQRQVLVLRYLFDLPGREIARALDRTPGEVRKLQHRALKFLRARLAAVGRAPEPRGRDSQSLGWQRRVTQVKVLRDRKFALLR